MNVEAPEAILEAGLEVGPLRRRFAVSRSLAALFAIEILLAAFVAAACFKILSTRRPPLVSERKTKTRLIWIDRSGRTIESVDLNGRFASPRTFAGNPSILLDKIAPSREAIWSFSPKDLQLRALLPGEGRTACGVLAPDSQEIVFASWPRGVVRSKMGSVAANAQRLGKDIIGIPEDWSPDGRWIALTARWGFVYELWLFEVASGRSMVVLKAENISEPRFSPDGRWMALTARFGGEENIYRVRVPAGISAEERMNALERVSPRGGHSSRWAENAEQLFYLTERQDLMAAELSGGTGMGREPRKVCNLAEAAPSGYEYRFDGYAFDRFRKTFIIALADDRVRE
jgi:WD40-like Beta Propeller Repeat